MRRILSLFLILAMLLPGVALADRMYILPESDSRNLTWEEVAQWDYESLGYAFNEIFARHGYVFNPGQEYDNYFSCMPWYTPNSDSNNQRAVYPYVTRVEWENYDLIKAVRADKKAYGDSGRSIWDNFSTGFDTLQGFDYTELRSGQSLSVYSAPTKNSWRGANGKAQVSTNGAIYAAGWESGWLLLMYETNNGSVRVGYVNADDIRGGVPVDASLNFAYDKATVLEKCTLTDDPARTGTAMTTLKAGTEVTYLTRYYNNSAWDYVETTVDGKVARGFIKAGSLDIDRGADLLEDVDHK
ncbi:MAG: YARHG domain-containing protein [Clostridia bacterium]|nr:YARHG domain-containing protein [Clostridia bacterium]